ncbi:MFS family permease [Paenibacillus jamilae]|uniref:MFS transporter n=1 Tax=Paenibacillus TaxID=44249 RepID=UPI000B824B32|nr:MULTISPECIES: MFS transporter [Paenibacillus]MDP9675568.1 MFS family permease [Paenibacillus jamilae]KAF6580381.1 MFS transporter [Paenibacillus sp. EKM211P]KAF6616449.1 MFS transporter [Paenibacillus sp. EKM101P]KAF6623747.1 MFS transporter [Paenibacillus sp. EKM102P]KAF6633691.1 MFS transporter [Paenibacillus sp. EKM10P]
MFKNPYIRTIIASNALLNLGIWVRNFAILLYVTDLTHNDPVYVSLISVAEFAPIFLFAIIGGTFADRWRPKRTMVSCDLLSAASIFIVLLALWYGSWQVLLLSTFFSAILSQFSQPSAMKILKQHVAPEQLQGVMALFQSLMALFMVIGPVVGTFIYQHFGIFSSLSITGMLFLISALVLTRIPQDEQVIEIDRPTHFIEELKEGIRYVWNNRTLRTLGGTFTIIGLAVGLIQPLMVFVAIENLGQDKEFLQWPLMANGAAMLLGGGLIMGVAKKVQPQLLLAAGLLVSTLTTFGVGWSHNIVLTMALQVLSGLFYPCIHIGINTMMMKNAEAAFIGRVGGALSPLFSGMMVVGMSIGGTLKRESSLNTVYTVSAGLFLLGAMLLLPLLRDRQPVQAVIADDSE